MSPLPCVRVSFSVESREHIDFIACVRVSAKSGHTRGYTIDFTTVVRVSRVSPYKGEARRDTRAATSLPWDLFNRAACGLELAVGAAP
jgi:hypothetical protein